MTKQSSPKDKSKPKNKIPAGKRYLLPEILTALLQEANLPKYEIETEYIFARPRLWRFDFAIAELRLAIEIEGGIYTSGRHTRGKGYHSDMIKYRTATYLGWDVVRYTPDEVNKAQTYEEIINFIKKKYNGELI